MSERSGSGVPSRNPLRPIRAPVPLPGARSRAALGLAAMAAEGRFALQVCSECGTVQYPPRDVCGACLGSDLPWRDVPPGGALLAATVALTSGESHFRERAPWPTGLVRSDAGPVVVAHLHATLRPDDRVRLDMRLDAAGRGTLIALPEDPLATTQDAVLDAFSADPRGRRVLITDGRTAIGPALARAFDEGGAETVFVGIAEGWKPFDRDRFRGPVEIVPLDLTDGASVSELAGRIGDKVDILVNNAVHVRPGGPVGGQDLMEARATFESNCLGLVRLASAFAPVMRARAAEAGRSSAAFVNLVSAWALAPEPGYGVFAASQAAVRALMQGLRAEARPAGLRVVEVLAGPIEDEWYQPLRPPKTAPAAVAKAVVQALREGREEVVVGDIARDIHARWVEDPRILRQEGP